MKTAVVFWSGTGNTEAMANAVADGMKEKGAEVSVLGPSDFTADKVAEFDAIAFGCPAMGAEVLEEGEFDPMFTACNRRFSFRQEDRTLRFLRMGRRRMDEKLGRPLQGSRRKPCMRQRYG